MCHIVDDQFEVLFFSWYGAYDFDDHLHGFFVPIQSGIEFI